MAWLKKASHTFITGVFLAGAFSTFAHAQSSNVQVLTGSPLAPVSVSNPLSVNASVSASITGFPGTSQTTGTPLAVTSAGVTGALPAGTVVVASNVGATNGAYCKLGASATTSDQLIPPNSWFGFTVGSNTQITCITSASTTTVNLVGGAGLPTGSGGGGGSSGGGSNTTATGNITSTQTVVVSPGAGQSSVGIQVTGTWTGTLFVEGSVDGTNYIQTTIVPILSGSVQTATITANGIFQANVAGLASFRIRGNTVASGTAVVTLISTTGPSTVMADNPFPVTGYTGMTALNVIGNTAIGSATTDKPLMMGGSSTGASGGNAQVAKVSASGLVSVDGSAVTQPISAASLPLPTGAATAANQTNVQGTVAAGTAAANSQLTGCVYNSSAPTLTTGQQVADQCDVNGNKLVKVSNTNANGRATAPNSSPVVQPSAPSTWHLIAAASTNATSVKASAAVLFSCQLSGVGSTPAFLKIYNKASAPTVGTDTPVKTLIIPAASTAANGAGSNISFGPGGLALGTGFAAAVTGVITDADTTAVAASTFAINCDYE